MSQCVLDGSQAIGSLMDAGVYTWAATARCGKLTVPAVNEKANCAIDVLSATEEIQKFVNVILATVDSCGGPKQSACGLAGGELAEKLTALGAASAEVVQECPSGLTGIADGKFNSQDLLRNPANQPPVPAPPATAIVDPNWQRPNELICTMDAKGAMMSLFKASVAMAKSKETCGGEDSRVCAYNALGIMEALGDVARYVQGTVGHCQQPNAHMLGNYPIQCASAISRVFAKTSGLAAAATKMAVVCVPAPAPAPPSMKNGPVHSMQVTPQFQNGGGAATNGNSFAVAMGLASNASGTHSTRLYGKGVADTSVFQKEAAGGVNYILAASLPITAVAAFFAGTKLRTRGAAVSRSIEVGNAQTFVEVRNVGESDTLI